MYRVETGRRSPSWPPCVTASDRTNGARGGHERRVVSRLCLVPALERGEVVLMNNFAAHKVSGVQDAIVKAGATLRYLPKYPPDLNPIELP